MDWLRRMFGRRPEQDDMRRQVAEMRPRSDAAIRRAERARVESERIAREMRAADVAMFGEHVR